MTRRYAPKRFYSWSHDLAYLSGLIASDGCLVNNGRHIVLTSKDEEIIQSAQAILNSNTKIRTKTGQFGTQAFHFQFSNVALYDFLYAAGITPAKSKTLQSVNVPAKFYTDFLRGYFDGDGTTYGYKDPRWKNSYMYYTGFISASHDFLLWLQAQNRRLISTSNGKIKPNTRAYTLTYAKADSQSLFSAMYRKGYAYMLTRKYQKLANFITTDPYAKIPLNARVLESVDRPR